MAKHAKSQQVNEGGGADDEEEIQVLELDFKMPLK
jgi:hypothetical protein